MGFSETGYSNSLQIWDATTGNLLQSIQAGLANDLDWNATNGLIATGVGFSSTVPGTSDGPGVRIWDPSTGRLVSQLGWYSHNVISVEWNTDGTQLLTVSADNTVRIINWPPPANENSQLLQGFMGAVTSLAWSPDGAQLVSGSEDGGVRVWNANTGEPFTTLLGNEREVWSVAWSPDGTQVASGGADFTVRSWEVDTGTISAFYKHEEIIFDNIPGVLSVAWSTDGTIASAGSDGTIRIPTGARPEVIEANLGSIFSVDWSPNGELLASASGTLQLWDVITEEPLDTLSCDEEGIWDSVKFSPDGHHLAASVGVGGGTGFVCVWDTSSSELAAKFDGLVTALTWSPDSEKIAVILRNYNTNQNTIEIWAVATGQTVAVIEEQPNATAIAWSPDGRQIAVGDSDGTIRIWGME